jgi:mannan endo-1,4-beta-mannosidase
MLIRCRKIKLVISLSLVISLVSCSFLPKQEASFVKVENGHFTIDGQPYYYVGTNYWYGAILGSTGRGGNRERLLHELDFMKKIGVDNLRILIGADGEEGIPFRVIPTLQKESGVYNDTIFEGLDFLLTEMGKRKMYAVLYINNSWEWSGGYSKYLNWTGHGKEPVPSIDGWEPFGTYVAQYADCEECHALFLNHVRHVITRTNRYTQKRYIDDPAIMAWQVGNEPRAFSDEAKPAFVRWLKEITRVIRELDPNHLISIGSEGKMGCENDMELFEEIHNDANVSYLTMHIWPKNWRWLNTDSIPQTVGRAIEQTNIYIKEHIAVAQKLNKPIVLEEFGLPRDNHKYTCEDPTTARDKYYTNAFEQIKEAILQRGVFSGCNFWAWGGTGRPAHEFWQPWDDYIGDPGQEEQGLNSVFDTDATIEIIRHYNAMIREKK